MCCHLFHSTNLHLPTPFAENSEFTKVCSLHGQSQFKIKMVSMKLWDGECCLVDFCNLISIYFCLLDSLASLHLHRYMYLYCGWSVEHRICAEKDDKVNIDVYTLHTPTKHHIIPTLLHIRYLFNVFFSSFYEWSMNLLFIDNIHWIYR